MNNNTYTNQSGMRGSQNIRVSHVTEGEPRVVRENQLPSRIINTKEGKPYLKDVRYGQPVEISRSTHYEENPTITTHPLQ